MMKEHQKFTILIVDDTYTNVLILKKTLANAGYNILVAENGPDGRALAEAEVPDLILLDIMMPEEDGFETIAKLKQNPIVASIPVIFITALSDMDSKLKGFALGAVDFISKPFHPSEIKARVRLHIRLSIATNVMLESQAAKLQQIELAQQAMLVQPDELPDAKFSVLYSSLNEAGGDFYDVIRIIDQTYGYFIADVAGHDIATGFLTAALKALLSQNCSAIYSPSESMQMLNRVLLDFLPSDKYLTACYLAVDRKVDTVTIVHMGHPPVFYVPVNGAAELLSYESDVLGAFSGVMFSANELKVAKGDRFFIYSDGLLENSSEKMLWSSGVDAIMQCADLVQGVDLNVATEAIYNYFLDKNSFEDDVVIMGIEV